MEVYFVNVITMGIIMLDQSLTTNIPDLDGFVLTTTCYAGSIWMELDRVDALFMVAELIDLLSRREVPKLDRSIS